MCVTEIEMPDQNEEEEILSEPLFSKDIPKNLNELIPHIGKYAYLLF